MDFKIQIEGDTEETKVHVVEEAIESKVQVEIETDESKVQVIEVSSELKVQVKQKQVIQ